MIYSYAYLKYSLVIKFRPLSVEIFFWWSHAGVRFPSGLYLQKASVNNVLTFQSKLKATVMGLTRNRLLIPTVCQDSSSRRIRKKKYLILSTLRLRLWKKREESLWERQREKNKPSVRFVRACKIENWIRTVRNNLMNITRGQARPVK